MKKIILASLCIALLSKAFARTAQSDPGQRTALSHKIVEIELPNPQRTEAMPGPFNHFEVIDARPDTSYIGAHTENLWVPMTRMRQLVLKGSVTRTIPDYLNNHFSDPEAPYKVLVVIRKLWISDIAYSYRQEEQKDEIYQKDDKINCRFRAEIYVSGGNQPAGDNSSGNKSLYTPVLRFDSLLVLDKNGYDRIGGFLSDLLQSMADTLATFDIDRKWETGRQLSLADIRRFSNSLYDFPIFRDTALVKGVYASFDEFRNNAPSIRDFEIATENKRSLLYTKDPSGNSFYNHKAWGLCDGKNLYVMLEGFLFPIFREQNAFYLSGFIESKTNAENVREDRDEYLYGPQDGGATWFPGTASQNNAVIARADYAIKHKNTVKRETRVFLVDPDTGAIY
ncbi:MAG: hypothetical protein P4L51_18095 [Puia sp.]|nr:hypothetical protein [Puia sp.]